VNDLNSILIEGLVTTLPENIGTVDAPRVRCAITARRLALDESGTPNESLVRVTIETVGNVAASCIQNVTVGRRIRVVGHLEGFDSGLENSIVIRAEYIEYTPFKTPSAGV
jgi:primosomal replication protein N